MVVSVVQVRYVGVSMYEPFMSVLMGVSSNSGFARRRFKVTVVVVAVVVGVFVVVHGGLVAVGVLVV